MSHPWPPPPRASCWHRNPQYLVEDADTVARQRAELKSAYSERFILGLAASRAELTENYRRPYVSRVEHLNAFDAATSPIPADRRVLAALGPKMPGLARDRAAGAHSYLVAPEYVEQVRTVLGAEPLLAPEVTVALDSNPGPARDTARGLLDYYLRLPDYSANLRRLGFTDDDLADAGSDRLVDALALWAPTKPSTAACTGSSTRAPTTSPSRSSPAMDGPSRRCPSSNTSPTSRPLTPTDGRNTPLS